MKRQQHKQFLGGSVFYCNSCNARVSRDDQHCSSCGEQIMEDFELALQPVFDDIAVKHHGPFAIDELDEGENDF